MTGWEGRGRKNDRRLSVENQRCCRSRPDFVLFVCDDAVMSSSLFNVQTERGEQRLALSAEGAHTCLHRLTCSFFSLLILENRSKVIKFFRSFSIPGTRGNRVKLIRCCWWTQGDFRERFHPWVRLFSSLAVPGRCRRGRPSGLAVSAAPPCPLIPSGWSRCAAEGDRCRRCADPPASAGRGVLPPGRWWRPNQVAEGEGSRGAWMWEWGGGAFTVQAAFPIQFLTKSKRYVKCFNCIDTSKNTTSLQG